MDKDKISEIINDIYLFYRVFVASHFSENLSAPHIKKISRELMKLYDGSDESFKRLCVAMPPSPLEKLFNYFGISNVAYISESELGHINNHQFR